MKDNKRKLEDTQAAQGASAATPNWKADLKASLAARKGLSKPADPTPQEVQPAAKKQKTEAGPKPKPVVDSDKTRRESGAKAGPAPPQHPSKSSVPSAHPSSSKPHLPNSKAEAKNSKKAHVGSPPSATPKPPGAPRNPFQSAARPTGGAVNPFASKGQVPRPAPGPQAQQRSKDASTSAAAAGSSALLEKMRAKLQGGRFRQLNETLYTQGGLASFQLMQEQPELFEEYHEGFREQTRGWPVQPVDRVIQWLKNRPKELVVADFGCGDAKIMDSVQQKVYSLDLVATRPGVIACNMAKTPLQDQSVDVAVFCLALMGVDYPKFLQEATRVLKPGGTLWIAEVRSRFAPENATDGDSAGSDDAGLKKFLRAMEQSGYRLQRQEKTKMFVELQLKRVGAEGFASTWPPLKACIYKRR